ncbi:cupin domain-containing protein, partial [Enterococcus faecium]
MEIDYKDHGKKPYIINIEDATTGNDNYRTTIWTGSKLQVTVMSIQPGDDIGLEVHEGIDQFIRIEEGEGVCKMGPSKDNLHVQQKVMDDDAV